MKKLWILLMALALVVGALPAFAVDTTIGGVIRWYGNPDPTGTASVVATRLLTTTKLDDFNTIASQIRIYAGGYPDASVVKAREFSLATDITGALGLKLPVTVKSKLGIWEAGLMQWFYASRDGYAYVNGGFDFDATSNGAAQLDVAVGPVTVSYLEQADLLKHQLGALAVVGPVSVWAGLKNDKHSTNLGIDTKYEGKFGDFALTLYPGFNYAIEAKDWAWGFGVGASYSMFSLAVDANGNNNEAFDKMVAEVSVAPVKDAALWVAMYMKQSAENALQGVDIMGSYKFGAAKLMVGYLIGGEAPAGYAAGAAIDIDGGNTSMVNGLYLGVTASF